ncbi:hypothetical protein OIT44_04050 [Weissella ceti]|uniref:Uncharacterized protein n=1 Tax=Weissella ceti TaxID=759620 RepID=A0ABT3E4C9_9LACO|nr:hypothetical protein [Weissella ceti]MCW0953247.1 hypothetical protein [Weissella ceti]QVK12763.1 hypothetical protein KHQ31_03810 [Weissella ceti]
MINDNAEIMELTAGKKAKLHIVEDIKPIEDGANIVIIPGNYGSPKEWASNKPTKRLFEFQINVEAGYFETALEVSDKIEKLLLKEGVLRFGDAFSDAIDYLQVVVRRYRFTTKEN